MSDLIDRQAAIEEFEDWANHIAYAVGEDYSGVQLLALAISKIKRMPSVQPTLYGYPIDLLSYIARVMEKEVVTAEYAVRTFDDMRRAVRMILDEAQQKAEEMLNERFSQPKSGN